MNPTRPNILWIFADQMRGMAMSCATAHHGPECNVYTPNLDRMAAEGVRFANACSTYPVCVPFRFTLMTGRRAMTRNIPAIHYRMSPAERTIAHDFNDAGYHTAYFGKWHLHAVPMGADTGGYVPPEYRGGFAEWHLLGEGLDRFHVPVYHGDEREPRVHDQYQTDLYFDMLNDFLGRNRSRPFFSVLSFGPPHSPFIPPEKNAQRQNERHLQWRPNAAIHEGAPPDDPEKLFNWGCNAGGTPLCPDQLERDLRGYYAMIENIDDNMGRLFDTLEDLGLRDNTYVFFFSDHGEMLGSHWLYEKRNPFEESVRIPLIVTGPDVARGQVYALPTCTEDFLPTTRGLAGLPVRDGEFEGLDLSAYLRDPRARPQREAVFLELVDELRQTMTPRVPWRAVRSERYKFIALQQKPWALYDLEQDPYEMNNRIADPDCSAVRESLIDKLIAHLQRVEDAFPFDREGIARHAPDGMAWAIPWFGDVFQERQRALQAGLKDRG